MKIFYGLFFIIVLIRTFKQVFDFFRKDYEEKTKEEHRSVRQLLGRDATDQITFYLTLAAIVFSFIIVAGSIFITKYATWYVLVLAPKLIFSLYNIFEFVSCGSAYTFLSMFDNKLDTKGFKVRIAVESIITLLWSGLGLLGLLSLAA